MITHWLGHMVVSAVVHAVAYGAAFAVFRHMSPTAAVGLAVLVIGGVFLFMIVLGLIRRLLFVARRRRRW
ncbi:hypothetical protein [Acidithiobacillus ferrianus]|uniref:hypothetical protein n=1 Tax=Acidithiobacillus ferrianus TaxID=2678518 RepID=UPI0034E4DA90